MNDGFFQTWSSFVASKDSLQNWKSHKHLLQFSPI